MCLFDILFPRFAFIISVVLSPNLGTHSARYMCFFRFLLVRNAQKHCAKPAGALFKTSSLVWGLFGFHMRAEEPPYEGCSARMRGTKKGTFIRRIFNDAFAYFVPIRSVKSTCVQQTQMLDCT